MTTTPPLAHQPSPTPANKADAPHAVPPHGSEKAADFLTERERKLYKALARIEHRLFAFGHVNTTLDRHDVSIMLDIIREAREP